MAYANPPDLPSWRGANRFPAAQRRDGRERSTTQAPRSMDAAHPQGVSRNSVQAVVKSPTQRTDCIACCSSRCAFSDAAIAMHSMTRMRRHRHARRARSIFRSTLALNPPSTGASRVCVNTLRSSKSASFAIAITITL